MKTLCIGISHKKASIEIREKFSLSLIKQELFLSELKILPWVLEVFVLSTCNRTEIYVNTLNIQQVSEQIIDVLFSVKKVSAQSYLSKYFYQFENTEAVKHLFYVIAGLDSLIIGEKQIQGQVKKAVDLARSKATLSRNFNILTNLAIEAGKKARRETNISFGGSSISWAALALAEKKSGDLKEKKFLIIGAGKMSKIILKQIKDRNVKKVFVMNRSQENAKMLAESIGGEVVSFCDMKEILLEVDICLCASGAPHCIMEKNLVEKIMLKRKNKLLVLVDISVPRNIEPGVSKVSNVQLYSIDDLDEATKTNVKRRTASIPQVKKIILDKVEEYFCKLNKLKTYEEATLSR